MKPLLALLLLTACTSKPIPFPRDAHALEDLSPTPPLNARLFVTVDGGDENPCTDSLPCATINGALGKLPKSDLGNVLISVGPGNFPCVSVSGFNFDPQSQSSGTYGGDVPGGSGIAILGSMAPSPLDAGTSTGTITGVTAGDISHLGATYNTVSDSSQSWVTNGLKGRWFIYTSGPRTGTRYPIYLNTTTMVTLVTGTSLVANVGDTYRIEEPSTFINTVCNIAPDVGLRTDGGYNNTTVPVAFMIADNVGISAVTLKVSQLALSNPTGRGFLIRSANRILLDTISAQNLSNTLQRVEIDQNLGDVIINASVFALAPTANQFLIQAHPANEPWAITYGLSLTSDLCMNGRACVSSTATLNMNTVAINPIWDWGVVVNGPGGNLIRGLRCETNTPASACIRMGDFDARGLCTSSLTLQSSTFNADSSAGGLEINGQCYIDVWRLAGRLDAGYALSVNFGAGIGLMDNVTNISGALGDVAVYDAASWGGSTVSYSLSDVKTAGPPHCTAPGDPWGSVVCATP